MNSDASGPSLLVELGSLGEGIEGGDGFDEAGDGEGIEDAAGQTNQMKRAAVAAQRDGYADQRGNAGTVDLRDAVEIDDDFADAAFHDGSESGGELVAGIADGETTVDVKHYNVAFAVHVDFDGSVLGHLKFIRPGAKVTFSYRGL